MHFVFLLYALFASIFTIGKFSLECAQPFFIVGSRMTLAGIILLSYMFYKDRSAFKLDSYCLKRLFLLAVFNIFLTNVCEFWGLQYLTSGKTCLLYSISPFISALLSYIVLSEVMNTRKWIALVTGFLGFLPIIMTSSGNEQASSLTTFYLPYLPEIALLSAATFSVYGWILIRQLVTEKDISPLMINGCSMFLGGLLALAYSYSTETWNPVPIYEGHLLGFLETALAMLVISNIICYNLYGHLLKQYTATFMSFAGFTTPIFAVLFGWVFLGETTPWEFWLSLAIVFISLYIFHKEEVQPGFIYQKDEEEKKSA